MMPPPSTAFASGLATPMDVGADVPLLPEADEEPASKKARICMVAPLQARNLMAWKSLILVCQAMTWMIRFQLRIPRCSS